MNTHKNNLKQFTTMSALSASLLFTSACSPDQAAGEQEASSTPANVLSQLVLDQPIANPLSVSEARTQANAGDPIQVTGQIGGTQIPFVQGYAGFVMADPQIDFCNELGDDHCAMPWDACCEDPDKLNAMRLSVQFVDVEGNPLHGDLKAELGLKELDTVIVSGTVSPNSSPDNLIVHATAMYRPTAN